MSDDELDPELIAAFTLDILLVVVEGLDDRLRGQSSRKGSGDCRSWSHGEIVWLK